MLDFRSSKWTNRSLTLSLGQTSVNIAGRRVGLYSVSGSSKDTGTGGKDLDVGEKAGVELTRNIGVNSIHRSIALESWRRHWKRILKQ